MASQVGVQRVGFTVTENRCLHKTKLHTCGYGESLCYIITCCIHDMQMSSSQRSITTLLLCIHWFSVILARIMNELYSKL